MAGHAWTVDKNQLIPSENFKVINWLEKSDSQLPDTEFTCQGFTINADECRKRAILSESLLDKYEDFLSRFDFLGIPQIPIPALDEDHPGTWVKVDEDQNETAAVAYQVIPGTINPNGSGLDGDSICKIVHKLPRR